MKELETLGLSVNDFRQLLRDSGFSQATVLYARAADGREVGDVRWDDPQNGQRSKPPQQALEAFKDGA